VWNALTLLPKSVHRCSALSIVILMRGVSWAHLGLVYLKAAQMSGPSACARYSFHNLSLACRICLKYAFRRVLKSE
jgi:hypothetical protein